MTRFSSRRARVQAMLLAALATTFSGAATMQQNNATAVSMLKLADDEYFRLDEERQSQIKKKMIVMGKYEGTALGAPSAVDLGKHDTVPLLWMTRMSNLRKWQVVTERNSTLIVADLDRATVSVHDAFAGPKKLNYHALARSGEGSAEAVLAPGGATAALRIVDLKAVANLPAQPGRYAVTLLVHDWVSNTVKLQLAGKGSGADGEGALRMTPAEAAVMTAKMQGMAQARAPAVSFGATDATPPLDAAGIALAGPKPGEPRAQLHGVARLTLAPGNLVRGEAGGLLHLLVLVKRLDIALPEQIALQVPLRGAHKVGEEVTLPFHVDIEAALRKELPPGVHQIYVAGAGHVSAPLALTLRGSGNL